MIEEQNNYLEELEAFHRVSTMVEFILEQFKLKSNILSFITAKLWENKPLCVKIDREVVEIWSKTMKSR